MHKLIGVLLAGVLAISVFAGMTAQEHEAGAEVEVVENPAGVLDVVIHAADFGVVPYSLESETVLADIIVTVTDDRGDNNGWDVTLSGTNFNDDTNQFEISNLSLSQSAIVQGDPGSNAGIATFGGPVAEEPDSSTIISAADGSGTGRYTVTFEDSALTVPGGTLVGEYQSTLTVSITSGP